VEAGDFGLGRLHGGALEKRGSWGKGKVWEEGEKLGVDGKMGRGKCPM